MNTPRLHLLIGVLTIAAFLITGLYMSTGFPELYHGREATRFMYRANHIYIPLAGLLNLLLSAYLSPSSQPWKAKLQGAGSFCLLGAVPVLILAFFSEPPRGSPTRLVTLIGIVALLLGTLCHLVGASKSRPGREQPS